MAADAEGEGGWSTAPPLSLNWGAEGGEGSPGGEAAAGMASASPGVSGQQGAASQGLYTGCHEAHSPQLLCEEAGMDVASGAEEEQQESLEQHAPGGRSEALEGVDSAHLEQLRQRQPGEDGGRRSWRVESVPYEFKDNGLDPGKLMEFLMGLLSIKCTGQGCCSQATITALLQLLKNFKHLIPAALRENLPDDFKALSAPFMAWACPGVQCGCTTGAPAASCTGEEMVMARAGPL